MMPRNGISSMGPVASAFTPTESDMPGLEISAERPPKKANWYAMVS
jgi:hypothetical protein